MESRQNNSWALHSSTQDDIIVLPHSCYLDFSISSLKQINCSRPETELKPAESCENSERESGACDISNAIVIVIIVKVNQHP